MNVAAEFPAYDPKHDPASCTRQPCRRCAGPHEPAAPKVTNNPHRVAQTHRREPSPFDPLVAPLTTCAPTEPEHITKLMTDLAEAISVHGQDRWITLLGWEKIVLQVSLVRDEPDEDADPDGKPRERILPAQTEEDRKDDRRTGRYAEDARHATAALLALLHGPTSTEALRKAVLRVRFLIAVAELRTPRNPKGRELLAAQAAADGWCRSCFRVGVFEPIACRPTGEPFYRDLCRWCGSNKGTAPQPPVDMVRVHHRIPERKTA